MATMASPIFRLDPAGIVAPQDNEIKEQCLEPGRIWPISSADLGDADKASMHARVGRVGMAAATHPAMTSDWIKIALSVAVLQLASGCSDGDDGPGPPAFGGAAHVGGTAGLGGTTAGAAGFGATVNTGGTSGTSPSGQSGTSFGGAASSFGATSSSFGGTSSSFGATSSSFGGTL